MDNKNKSITSRKTNSQGSSNTHMMIIIFHNYISNDNCIYISIF